MKFSFARLTTNQRLAALAFLLGLIAIAATPAREGRVSVLPRDLAIAVQRSSDHVSVRQLAKWLIEGRADIRVIDVRSADAYAKYHVPSAEHVTLAALPDAGFLRNEKLLLYDDDGVHAVQAWFLLRSQGYRGVYLLDGGLEAWKAQVLFPRLGEASTAEARQKNDELRAVSLHFGGTPLAAGSGEALPGQTAVAPPLPVAPAVASPGAARPAAKKRKEGC